MATKVAATRTHLTPTNIYKQNLPMENRQDQDLSQDLVTMTDQQLVERYNLDVAKGSWKSARPGYSALLIREFDRRGLDHSAISDGDTLSYQTRVAIQDNKVVPAEDAGA